ncbi:MAG: N-acetylmuramoyl-L-alanine amidase [Candidatus Acidiferrales bacterium]
MASAAMKSLARGVSCTTALALGVLFCAVLPARADKQSDAREQFARAVKMRTMLEGYLEKDRSRSDYIQTVAAYHKVYMITPLADDATSALMAEAELYREMGRLYDPRYFESAIATYLFLAKQYPGSRYHGEVLLSVAQVQKDDLDKPQDAEATYKEYLKHFPRSDRADQARAALKEIAQQGGADQDAEPAGQPPEPRGQHVTPRAVEKGSSIVKDLQTWNAQDSTRIVVTLGDTIAYDAAHLASPDRIYFDLYKARLDHKLSSQSFDAKSGLLKSIRIAQNKPDVVRVVLDAGAAKDYSAFLLANPYRLVIDIHAQPVNTAKQAAGSASSAPPAEDVQQPAANPPVAAAEVVAAGTASKPPVDPADPKPARSVNAKAIGTPAKSNSPKFLALEPPPVPQPNRDGQRSLTRALGLKINRIVIDAGHGGHDTGTIGPHGLMEKDLCLDVALRLGNLIEQKLPGADVIYTRKDDAFVPLEERTRIANDAKADLFISIHANSSQDPSARGVETYYLNFATSEESMEVAARENANSQESMHDLQDLIKKIARNDKIEESKDLAGDIQDNLTQRLQLVSRSEKNRGVKKAPFVVLIGANMPSVLSEVSFVSNPNDERLLRKGDQRQRIADGLYRGIATYLDGLNSLTSNKQKLVSDNHVPDIRLEAGTVAPTGNPK